jgi:hypothetical protein
MSRRPPLVSPVWGPVRIMCGRPPKNCSMPCSCWPANRSAVITIWTISRRGFCRLSAIRQAGRGRAHAFGLGHRLPLPWPGGRAGAIARDRRTGTNDPYVEGIRRRGWRPHQRGKMTVKVETGGHGVCTDQPKTPAPRNSRTRRESFSAISAPSASSALKADAEPQTNRWGIQCPAGPANVKPPKVPINNATRAYPISQFDLYQPPLSLTYHPECKRKLLTGTLPPCAAADGPDCRRAMTEMESRDQRRLILARTLS